MPQGVNKRVYYPIHAVGFATLGTPVTTASGFRAAKGVQSIATNVNFNLEAVNQLGQIEIYENIEDIPNVEVTIEKALDGYSLIEHLASVTATAATLNGRYNDARSMVLIPYYTTSFDSASGVPLAALIMSGMYVSAINMNIPVQGNITESVTLVGNDRTWSTGLAQTPFTSATQFNNAESPVTASGGIQRRENVIMASSIWPLDVPGISGIISTGNNPIQSDGSYSAHIQNTTISTNFGRTELFELGHKGPYYRYAEFPTEVTCSIEITASEYADFVNARGDADNLTDRTILIVLSDGTRIDLGTKNKLASVTTNGGDATGGNVTTVFNYSNQNSLKITHPRDPANLS